MKISIISVFVFSAVILSACQSNEVMESKNVAQSEIHQQYYITYSMEDELLSVNAEFRVAGPNGTTLVLSEPSDITCDGEELKLDTYLLGGAHYTLSKKVPLYSESAELVFIDTEKKRYENYLLFHIMYIDEQLSNLETFSKEDRNHITLKSHPLEPNEKMWLEIQGDSLSKNLEMEHGGGIEISHEDLKEFRKNENLNLQFVREKTGKLPNATARGGNYTITVRSIKRLVILH